jgi:hypothetical protein
MAGSECFARRANDPDPYQSGASPQEFGHDEQEG